MEVTPQQYKELHSIEVKEKQKESNEAKINELLSSYFVWFMNNGIDEFRMFCKFWNKQFSNNQESF